MVVETVGVEEAALTLRVKEEDEELFLTSPTLVQEEEGIIGIVAQQSGRVVPTPS